MWKDYFRWDFDATVKPRFTVKTITIAWFEKLNHWVYFKTDNLMKRLKYFFIKTIAFGFNLDFWVWLSFTQSVIEGSKNRFPQLWTDWHRCVCCASVITCLLLRSVCEWVSNSKRLRERNRKIERYIRKIGKCVCV